MIGAQFYEPLKLEARKGFEFAATLSDYIDPRGVTVKDDAWVFAQPLGESAAGFLQVIIQPTTITLEARLPTHVMEYFETRYKAVLNEFRKSFHPTWLPASFAKVYGTIDVDGDARAFLCEQLTQIGTRLGPLDRPIQLFGIRFAMPAFELHEPPTGKRKQGKLVRTVDWSVEVKAESLFVDATKLYVEATGTWQPTTPKPWNETTINEIVQHLVDVSDYLKDHLLPFLTREAEDGET